ncbi:TylF/MycF family methyltransferase [Amycolatopsis sp. YIM 10]|uniref:TylF/MycF family methyltransferase n=1 Tax=Amycolatopsis sp. YIM 10 TaxID=2653857 RepID=UPI0012903215|nr:TylF/MycF family methyltransferase [Amycolatopsis sp. YIM 10]QFU89733.1 Mycinamicin III 3''-O-methyltransferase [Amycolatopsis sp. YIM 10]
MTTQLEASTVESGARERELYLNLMKRVVTNLIYQDSAVYHGDSYAEIKAGVREERAFDASARESGLDHPRVAHTMVGVKRLDNIQECLESVLADDVPGDFIETGVWRGGASIFARAVLKAHGVTDRTVWVADSFEGLPPNEREPIHLLNDLLAVSEEAVRENFRRYGLLDDQVRFVKGWFCDSLPTAEVERLSVLRLDGDLYESTMDALDNLYPKLSAGGFVIVDDYYFVPGCRLAILEFRRRHGITDPVREIDGVGTFWRKTG